MMDPADFVYVWANTGLARLLCSGILVGKVVLHHCNLSHTRIHKRIEIFWEYEGQKHVSTNEQANFQIDYYDF